MDGNVLYHMLNVPAVKWPQDVIFRNWGHPQPNVTPVSNKAVCRAERHACS